VEALSEVPFSAITHGLFRHAESPLFSLSMSVDADGQLVGAISREEVLVLVALPKVVAQPTIKSVLVRQDGLLSEFTLFAIQVSLAAALPLTLPKPLFLYLRKDKVMKDLGLLAGEGCSFPPSVLLLVGGWCSISGGFFGLFSSPTKRSCFAVELGSLICSSP
jgi:hypothetical protein